MKEKEKKPLTEQQYRELVRNLVSDYLEVYPEEGNRLAKLYSLLDEGLSLTDRKNFVGHLTASAIVIDAANRILLLHHRSLNKRLQPGGHVDGLELPLEAVLREIEEETSISQLQPHPSLNNKQIPFDIDTHTIPANAQKHEAEHLHHDFRFLLLSSEEVISIDESEVINSAWFDIEEAKSKSPDLPWQKILDVLGL